VNTTSRLVRNRTNGSASYIMNYDFRVLFSEVDRAMAIVLDQ